MSKNHIIIVAAGSGSRFGGPLPKQFCDLAGRPVLMHTIDAFRSVLPDAAITLVLSESGCNLWQDLCIQHSFDSPTVIIGGSSRYRSVCNAISTVSSDADYVMVHDGARPFPPYTLLKSYESLLNDTDYVGVIPVVPVTDSLRHIDANGNNAVNRSTFRAVQTPQIFHASMFFKAYKAAQSHDEHLFTDDASVIDAFGGKLLMAKGSVRNIKITNPGDIALAEFYISHPE